MSLESDEIADALKYLYWACQRLLEIVDARPDRHYIADMSTEQRLAAAAEKNLEEVEQALRRGGVSLE